MPKRFIGADPLERPDLFVSAGDRAGDSRHAQPDGRRLSRVVADRDGTDEARGDSRAGECRCFGQQQRDPPRGYTRMRTGLPTARSGIFSSSAESGSTGFTYIRLFFRKPLMAVFAMCGGILLLACLNLASLLMARGTARQKELATRLAMGATRRQAGAAVAGGKFPDRGRRARWQAWRLRRWSASRFQLVLLGSQSETHVDTSLDLRVFAFAALAAIVAALLIGLLPALRATSGNLSEQMKHGQHTTLAYERQAILPRVMMAVEVALALMLVVGAGLLATSLVRLYRSGTGFDPRGVENIAFSMDQQPLKGDALIAVLSPGRRGAKPPAGREKRQLRVDGPVRPFYVGRESIRAERQDVRHLSEQRRARVFPDDAHSALLEGRDFRWDDTASAGSKIILNQAAAKLLFPDRKPDRPVRHGEGRREDFSLRSVGVVGDAKYDDLRSAAPPTAYHSHERRMIRSTRGPTMRSCERRRLRLRWRARRTRSADQIECRTSRCPLMTSMSDMVRDSMSAERMMALLSVFFAVCALVVTAVGLYGTLAYATDAPHQRDRHPHGSGSAARAGGAGWCFVQNAAVAIAGTAAGVVAALLASRALASFLYGTSTRDPWVFAGSIVALAPDCQCGFAAAGHPRCRDRADGGDSLRVNERGSQAAREDLCSQCGRNWESIFRWAPAQNHAEGQDKEQTRGLLQRHHGIEVAAREEANGGERITTRKKAFDRCIMMVSPVRTSREVTSNGHASATPPIRNATAAQVHGTRKAGTRNIENPVAIPSGGMMIFLTVTAVRPSRMRHARTPSKPITAAAAEAPKPMCTIQPTSLSLCQKAMQNDRWAGGAHRSYTLTAVLVRTSAPEIILAWLNFPSVMWVRFPYYRLRKTLPDRPAG